MPPVPALVPAAWPACPGCLGRRRGDRLCDLAAVKRRGLFAMAHFGAVQQPLPLTAAAEKEGERAFPAADAHDRLAAVDCGVGPAQRTVWDSRELCDCGSLWGGAARAAGAAGRGRRDLRVAGRRGKRG